MICKRIESGTVLLCIAWMLVACSNQTESQDVSLKIDSNLQQILNSPEMILTSSNPGDYIGTNTEAYVQILDTGEEGLNVLIQQLESSSHDGLKEWLRQVLSCSENVIPLSTGKVAKTGSDSIK